MKTTQQTPGDGQENGEADRLITAFELAHRLGVTASTIHDWARDGRIPCLRVGQKTLRFNPDAVIAFLETNGLHRRKGGDA